MKYTAKTLSILFHPILMPLLGVFIIFNSGIYQSNIPVEIKKYTYLLVGLFSIVLPLALISILVYWHVVQNIEMSKHKERFIPMTFSFISIFLLHVLIRRTIPINILQAFTLSMAVVLILYLLSNIKFKTSLHLLALGGITGLIAILSKIFLIDLYFWLMIVIFVTGIVGTSRVYLEEHTLLELAMGYVTGFVGVFFTVYFFI